MAPKPNQFLSALVFLSMTLNFPAPATSQECPYPCFPPPTGTVNTPPTPPSTAITPPSETGTYYPPPAFYYPPPTGYFPFSPPTGYFPYSPPYAGVAPPPPDPIVPWFPFYYRKPPHQSDQSSSTALSGPTAVIAMSHFLSFLIFFAFSFF